MGKKEKLMITICLILFLVVGIMIICGSLSSKINCTETTTATITDVYKVSNSHRNSLPKYYPILEYEIDGEKYENRGHIAINPNNSIGKQIEIKYNPQNPNQFTYNKQNYGQVIIGGGFIFISLIFLFGIFRNRKVQNI